MANSQVDCGGVSAIWKAQTYEAPRQAVGPVGFRVRGFRGLKFESLFVLGSWQPAGSWHSWCTKVGAEGSALRWWLELSAAISQVRVAAWLPNAAVEGAVDGSPVTVRRRPAIAELTPLATASSTYQGRGAQRMVDADYDTEWFAAKGEQEAWVMFELLEETIVDSVAWTWWAKSMGDKWQLSSRREKSGSWTERSNSKSMPSVSEFNGEVHVSGWQEPTRWIRLQMQNGHLDPWNFGVFFGIRSFTIWGVDEAAVSGASDLWKEGAPAARTKVLCM